MMTKIEVGDKIRLKAVNSMNFWWWENYPGPMEVYKVEERTVYARHPTEGNGGFNLEWVELAEETAPEPPTDQELADQYRDAYNKSVAIRSELCSRGFKISHSTGAQYNSTHKTCVPGTVKIVKSTITTQEL